MFPPAPAWCSAPSNVTFLFNPKCGISLRPHWMWEVLLDLALELAWPGSSTRPGCICRSGSVFLISQVLFILYPTMEFRTCEACQQGLDSVGPPFTRWVLPSFFEGTSHSYRAPHSADQRLSSLHQRSHTPDNCDEEVRRASLMALHRAFQVSQRAGAGLLLTPISWDVDFPCPNSWVPSYWPLSLQLTGFLGNAHL